MDLPTYISQNLQLGYDFDAIRQTLLSQGYTDEQIHAALDYISASGTVKKKKIFSKRQVGILAIVVIGFILIILASILFLLPEPVVNKPVDRDPIQREPPVRDPIETDPVTADEVDPVQIPTEPEETPFEVIDEEIPVANIPDNQIDEVALQLAEQSADQAISLCKEKQINAGIYNCITQVAVKSSQPQYCGTIQSIQPRDICYMNFALENKGTVQDICTPIITELRKEICILTFQKFAKSETIEIASQEEILNSSASIFDV